jgi:hypothetical protein
MSVEKEKIEGRFEVLCIWCGVRIRRDNLEDSHGACLKCFYQILNERLRAQRRVRLGAVVSDR